MGLFTKRIFLTPPVLAFLLSLLCSCGRKTEETKEPSTSQPSNVPPSGLSTSSPLPHLAPTNMHSAPVSQPPPPAQNSSTGKLDQTSLESVSNKVESLRQVGEFDAAIALLSELRGLSGKEADRVAAEILELKNEKRELVSLTYAVDQLASENDDAAEIATEKLLGGGEVAKIALRKAVREAKDSLAIEASRLLADMDDSPSVPIILKRFIDASDELAVAKYATALIRLSRFAQPYDYALLAIDNFFTNRFEAAQILAQVYKNTCNRDSKRFDKAFGTGAYVTLHNYVSNALTNTNNPRQQRWAVENTETFNLLGPGIRGTYYAGTSFESLVFERIDDKIWVEDRKFPYPDGRQDEISIRWTGKIFIPRQGRYTFKIYSDDGNRLRIDGKLLFEHWGSPANHEAAIDLTSGLHDICIEFQQGGGGAWIKASWIGPDFAEKPLNAEVLRSFPVVISPRP